jgi:hypothetical protein
MVSEPRTTAMSRFATARSTLSPTACPSESFIFEAVEVDEEHSELSLMTPRQRGGMAEGVGQQRPVGELGERIVLREVSASVLPPLPH